MVFDPMLALTIRLNYGIDCEPIPAEAGSALNNAILDLVLDAGARRIERVQKAEATGAMAERLTVAEFVKEEPPKRFRAQRDMTERLRTTLCRAVKVGVAGFDYASASEYGVYRSTEGEVVQVFFFWSGELYEPQHAIEDAAVAAAISGACPLVEPMLEKCTPRAVFPHNMMTSVPHAWKLKKIRWLYREPGKFVPGIHVDLPPDGVGIRADGLESLCRFFVNEYVFEAVHEGCWLLAGMGQAALVVRSKTRLDDSKPGMKSSSVCGNIKRDTGVPEDPETLDLIFQHKNARDRLS